MSGRTVASAALFILLPLSGCGLLPGGAQVSKGPAAAAASVAVKSAADPSGQGPGESASQQMPAVQSVAGFWQMALVDVQPGSTEGAPSWTAMVLKQLPDGTVKGTLLLGDEGYVDSGLVGHIDTAGRIKLQALGVVRGGTFQDDRAATASDGVLSFAGTLGQDYDTMKLEYMLAYGPNLTTAEYDCQKLN